MKKTLSVIGIAILSLLITFFIYKESFYNTLGSLNK